MAHSRYPGNLSEAPIPVANDEPSRANPSVGATGLPQQTLTLFLVIGASVYVLLWMAIFNGYPLLFPDTPAYFWESFTLTPLQMRPIGYGLFIRLASAGMSPWLIVLVQSVLTVFVLYLTFRCIARNSKRSLNEPLVFMGLVGVLSLGTALPWSVGEIMPDIFTGLAFLCVILILYDHQLSSVEKILLALVLAISLASHLSHFLILGLLLLTVALLRQFDAAWGFWPSRSTRGIVAFILIPFAAATCFTVWKNWRSGYGFRLSTATPIFMMGRLLQSGLAVRYLDQECTIEHLTPCNDLHNLPRSPEAFLWRDTSLLESMGGWIAGRAEANKIVMGTIRKYPLSFLADCVKQTVRQFLSFKPGYGDGMFWFGDNRILNDYFFKYFPNDVEKFHTTHEWLGKLPRDAAVLSPIYAVVFWCSLVGCLAFFFRHWGSPSFTDRLFLFTICLLVFNAFVTGAFSEVSPRYQCRVVWLVPLCFVAYLISLLGNREMSPQITTNQTL